MRFAYLAMALFLVGCCCPWRKQSIEVPAPALEKALDQVHKKLSENPEPRLFAGAAMVDITTDLARQGRIYLGGFDMGRRNKGVRDPVYAHVLYLDDGRDLLVIVSLDLIGLMNDDIREIRAMASDQHQDRIVIASTHDHVGPDAIGYWGPALFGYLPLCPGTVPEYMAAMKRLAAHAIDQAALSARPARIRVATGTVDPSLSLNIHPEIRTQKDDLLRVLAVEDASDGRPIAVLANFGCHAEAMWDDEQLSADWPGVFYERLAKEVGGVPIFVQGAVGGLVTVNPGDEKMRLEPEIMDVFNKHMSREERLALRDRVGNTFFEAVRTIIGSAKEAFGPEGVSLSVAFAPIELEQHNWVFDYMGKRGLIRRETTYKGRTAILHSDVIAARIRASGRILLDIATIPGEPSPPLVADLDASSPAEVRITISLGNDEIGYILREADWPMPYYEYERTMSLGPGTGTVISKAIAALRAGL